MQSIYAVYYNAELLFSTIENLFIPYIRFVSLTIGNAYNKDKKSKSPDCAMEKCDI